MSQYTTLQDGFRVVMEHLESLGFSEYSKDCYRKSYSDILEYYESRHENDYSPAINLEYRDRLLERHALGNISKKEYNRFSRLSFMLDSHFAGEPFALKYSRGVRYKVKLDECHQTLADGFTAFLKGKLTEATIPGYLSIARDFFYFLQSKDTAGTGVLDNETVLQFIKSSHECRPASMNNVCCVMRKVTEYMASSGYRVTVNIISYKASPTRREIQPALNAKELTSILGTPDRGTPMGKRDYAVLLLASFTGLRAIDIANLRFRNYDPAHKSIRLVQHKTGTPIGMPVPSEVVDAINDYVDHGRPNVDNGYIFITINQPYRKLSDASSIRNILLKQLKGSGIGYAPGSGKGFHAFRRTMGKWLLGASINPEMISQILGHRDKEVLKRYLPISPDAMRDCPLGFDTAPLRSEVYV